MFRKKFKVTSFDKTNNKLIVGEKFVFSMANAICASFQSSVTNRKFACATV